jgi:hypothetical protein
MIGSFLVSIREFEAWRPRRPLEAAVSKQRADSAGLLRGCLDTDRRPSSVYHADAPQPLARVDQRPKLGRSGLNAEIVGGLLYTPSAPVIGLISEVTERFIPKPIGLMKRRQDRAGRVLLLPKERTVFCRQGGLADR